MSLRERNSIKKIINYQSKKRYSMIHSQWNFSNQRFIKRLSIHFISERKPENKSCEYFKSKAKLIQYNEPFPSLESMILLMIRLIEIISNSWNIISKTNIQTNSKSSKGKPSRPNSEKNKSSVIPAAHVNHNK